MAYQLELKKDWQKKMLVLGKYTSKGKKNGFSSKTMYRIGDALSEVNKIYFHIFVHDAQLYNDAIVKTKVIIEYLKEVRREVSTLSKRKEVEFEGIRRLDAYLNSQIGNAKTLLKVVEKAEKKDDAYRKIAGGVERDVSVKVTDFAGRGLAGAHCWLTVPSEPTSHVVAGSMQNGFIRFKGLSMNNDPGIEIKIQAKRKRFREMKITASVKTAKAGKIDIVLFERADTTEVTGTRAEKEISTRNHKFSLGLEWKLFKGGYEYTKKDVKEASFTKTEKYKIIDATGILEIKKK